MVGGILEDFLVSIGVGSRAIEVRLICLKRGGKTYKAMTKEDAGTRHAGDRTKQWAASSNSPRWAKRRSHARWAGSQSIVMGSGSSPADEKADGFGSAAAGASMESAA